VVQSFAIDHLESQLCSGVRSTMSRQDNSIHFVAVGFRYLRRAIEPSQLKDGCITLEMEPNNPHDPLAVKVLLNGKHVGYVARCVTHKLHVTAAVMNKLLQLQPDSPTPAYRVVVQRTFEHSAVLKYQTL